MNRDSMWDDGRAYGAPATSVAPGQRVEAANRAASIRTDLAEIVSEVHAGTARLAALGEKLGQLVAALDDAERRMREYEATIAGYEAQLAARRDDEATIQRLRAELDQRDQAFASVKATLAQLDHRLIQT